MEKKKHIKRKVAGRIIVPFMVLALGIFFAHDAHAEVYSTIEHGSGSERAFSAEANLSGSQEVPQVSTSASGSFSASQNTNENLRFTLNVSAIDKVTEAHLHCGAPGVNGPVVVTLYNGGMATTTLNGVLASGSIEQGSIRLNAGCAQTIATVDDLKRQMANGQIYVNVHTTDYPNGEIRGQVSGTFAYGDDGHNTCKDGWCDDSKKHTHDGGNTWCYDDHSHAKSSDKKDSKHSWWYDADGYQNDYWMTWQHGGGKDGKDGKDGRHGYAKDDHEKNDWDKKDDSGWGKGSYEDGHGRDKNQSWKSHDYDADDWKKNSDSVDSWNEYGQQAWAKETHDRVSSYATDQVERITKNVFQDFDRSWR